MIQWGPQVLILLNLSWFLCNLSNCAQHQLIPKETDTTKLCKFNSSAHECLENVTFSKGSFKKNVGFPRSLKSFFYKNAAIESRSQTKETSVTRSRHFENLTNAIPIFPELFGKEKFYKASRDMIIINLHRTGHPKNRIDVVFMGDGYTAEEQEKYFEDVRRLSQDSLYFSGFSELLPMMNIWAIFVPSAQSGIGTGAPKNTAFRLYRRGLTYRTILIRRKRFARRTCRQVGRKACDFPIIIGNDDFYGGLGGEFAISTRSINTGHFVLRHELGHNFARVGEEYDKGDVYSGANSASSLRSLPWRHWLTNDSAAANGRQERAIYRILWSRGRYLDLGPFTKRFFSSGRYSRWTLVMSVSGAPEDNAIEIFLDETPIPWKSRGSIDKESYMLQSDFESGGLSRGYHTLRIFTHLNESYNPDYFRLLSYVSLVEEGNEDEFRANNEVISAYPTWSSTGRKTYRPTVNGCVMRNMSLDHLCSVCMESAYLNFLRKVNLIDSLSVGEEVINFNERQVTLKTIDLGQFRKMGRKATQERLSIRWKNMDREEMVQFSDQLQVNLTSGQWTVHVQLLTTSIRRDRRGHSKDFLSFTVD